MKITGSQLIGVLGVLAQYSILVMAFTGNEGGAHKYLTRFLS